MKMIIWTCLVEDSHPEQIQEDWIIDTSSIHLLKPFHSSDHVGPEPIVEEEIWKDILPPLIVDSLLFLSHLPDSMEGVLGNLQFSISVSTSRNEEGNYLVSQRVVTITQRWSVFPVVPMTDVPQEPTSGQLDDWMTTVLSEDRRPDDWMSDVGSHW